MSTKTDITDAQRVLAASGLYGSKVDGLMGPETRRAIERSEGSLRVDKRWKESRRLIAAMQRELNRLGFESGAADGLRGAKTNSALSQFAKSKAPQIPAPARDTSLILPAFNVPRRRNSAEMIKVFGQPGDGNRRNSSGKVLLPFPFVIAWNKSQRVSSFQAHERAAPVFESVFRNAAAHYGEEQYRALGLDLFGGCYNPRRMRGGVSWSTHAWGVAVDLDPESNQLKWTKSRARFARPDYDAFWNIVEAHKCVSLGRARDYDWMHFQLARED